MVIAYMLFGIVGGAIGFIGALVLGYSLWSAILSYSLVGSVTALLVPLLRMTVGQLPKVSDMEINLETTQTLEARQGVSDEQLSVSPSTTELTMKILAVDDEPFILELIPKIAARVGFLDVTTVSSGALAMQAIERADIPFDCLLLDINMPGMNGIDLCARIRQTDGYDSASIIMLTAMSDTDHIERAFLAGATDYTSKPFDIIEFGERMQSAHAWTAIRRIELRGDRLARTNGGHSRCAIRMPKLLNSHVKMPLLSSEYALENYVSRLTRSTKTSAYVMAIALDAAAQPVDDLQSAKLTTWLPSIAVAIDDVFKSDDYAVSYAEEGRFVVASRALFLPPALLIEAAIQDRLNSMQVGIASVRGNAPQISVGSFVRLGGRNVQWPRLALDTAIHLAETRTAQKKGALPAISAMRA